MRREISQPMAGRILIPPNYADVVGPLIFLAGPIQGAPPWQTEAIHLLQSFAPELHIANPRREYLPGEFAYSAQVDWESRYLRRAAENGVILFWLAREIEHRCDRSYAQTTRFELAEWKVRHERDSVQLVVGIEQGFTGERYIRHRFGLDCPAVPIVSTLQDVCLRAVKLVEEHVTRVR